MRACLQPRYSLELVVQAAVSEQPPLKLELSANSILSPGFYTGYYTDVRERGP